MRKTAISEALEEIRNNGIQTMEYYIRDNPVPQPESERDVTFVQLKDMDEKMVTLIDKIQAYRENKGGKARSETAYRRLSEACVKYSIQLDRVNVVGRERDRDRRREMLLKLDQLSTDLVLEQVNNPVNPV